MNNCAHHAVVWPITEAKLFAYQLPFSSPINFNGQQLKSRQGLILQLQDSHQQLSFGEIAPLPGFSRETLTQATAQILTLLNSGLENLQPQKAQYYPSVNFALACALQKIPLDLKATNIDSVPLLQGDNTEVLKQYLALKRPALIKLKVARQTVDNDILLFKQLSELNPYLMIRCDANKGWSRTQASYFFEQIDNLKLDYIEEPTRVHQANLQLAEKYQIRLAVDETLHNIDFNYQHKACIKALVLKPMLIGSLSRVQNFIEIAGEQQLQVHISSSFESIIGLQQLTALAARYKTKCSLSLGIDTLKYFQNGLLTDSKQIKEDLQKLECLWSSN
ncbi:MAG: o-succinylbenzoate synthase [Psychromonas sp.]|nr:o-succinylbenzoate synthase [Psychromonas sp.]